MIIKKINVCENNRQLLDTGVIDQLLSIFCNETVFVCLTFSTIEGWRRKYYGKYIGKHKIGEKVEIILVPLCNGSHFTGYIIDFQRKESVYVDSMYPLKSGKRSIATWLVNTYEASKHIRG